MIRSLPNALKTKPRPKKKTLKMADQMNAKLRPATKKECPQKQVAARTTIVKNITKTIPASKTRSFCTNIVQRRWRAQQCEPLRFCQFFFNAREELRWLLRQLLRQLFFRFFSFLCGRFAAEVEGATMRTVAILPVFF